MAPSELQELLDFEPFTPLRLILASGDIVELHQREGLSIADLSLAVEDIGMTGTRRLRLVSIPNICMAEPLPPRTQREGNRMEGDTK